MTSGAFWTDAAIPLLILLTAWLTPSLTGPTLPFGVRVPPAQSEHPVIAEQRRSYRLLLGAGGGVLVLLGALLAALAPDSPAAALPPLAALAGGAAAYVRARRAIRAVKQREDWYRGLRQSVAVDTALRTSPEPFPWLWTLPALFVLAATAVLGVLRYPSMPQQLPTHYNGSGAVDHFTGKSVGTAFALVFVQAALTLVVTLVAWLSFRSRADLDPARPAASAYRHRRFIVRMTVSVLLLAACANLTVLLGAWGIWHGDRTMGALPLLLPTLAGLALTVVVAVRTGQNGSRVPLPEDLTADEPAVDTKASAVHQDDDRYWRGGMVYVNRQDPALFVGKRFGVGWTVNLGNPRALLLVAGLVAGTLAIDVLTR
ncbi:putative membrane protein [Kitasatospora sp. MAA4]|uniref:DUF1648 domain-containing protein n=1 Tax=Kitasatospora sp. MAA4 TaxID=3035093 RepID=UPI0024771C19|nr:DUF5808 domain-containing protein [Kitasatospora sp. MAA4]MDH6137639.1 putative membrane protein [Kitasatospora sp. MAA4]